MSWIVLSRWSARLFGVLIVTLLLSLSIMSLAQRPSDTMRVEINAISGMQYDQVTIFCQTWQLCHIDLEKQG